MENPDYVWVNGGFTTDIEEKRSMIHIMSKVAKE